MHKFQTQSLTFPDFMIIYCFNILDYHLITLNFFNYLLIPYQTSGTVLGGTFFPPLIFLTCQGDTPRYYPQVHRKRFDKQSRHIR